MPAIVPLQMSLLSRQLALGADAFLFRYPHCWLVWEAGGWTTPARDAEMNVAETTLGEVHMPQPLNGDALCFPLRVHEGATLRLGRAEDNELVISDLTVSRVHAQLELGAEGWLVLPVNAPLLVDDDVVAPGSRSPLSSGLGLELGRVRLVFHDAKDFRRRVSTVPLRAPPAELSARRRP